MAEERTGQDGDTVKLLRECDSGIKMGVEAIDEVLDKVSDRDLGEMLKQCKYAHQALGAEVEKELDIHGDGGKSPSPAVKSMSFIKCCAKLRL